jgi:hypothetical protein
VSATGVLAVIAMSLSLWTQAAMGLEPGVHVDPGSPAAKQYALPLNQARDIGSRGTGGNALSSPLFGAGIRASGHDSRGTAKGSDAHSGSRQPSREGSLGRSRESARPSREGSFSIRRSPTSLDVQHSAIAAHEGFGDGSLLALLGGGIAVLLLAGIGGVTMRRTRRSPSSL